MLTLKQKELKKTRAKDITKDNKTYKGLTCIGKSYGTYGMNGALFVDKKGNMYKITSRSSNLFKYC